MAISIQRALLIVAVLFLWTSESQQTPAIQAAALSQFFDATNGPAWVSYCSSLWQSSSPPCSWFGVMCDNVSNVIGLGLVGCNLQGALPMSLEDISTLQFLTLTNNAITKPLPQWTQLGSLLSLALGNNLVNDTLPDSWAALTSLQDFDMSNNPLTSTLPVSWGSKMTNLRRVDLSNASIQGLLPGTWCRVFSGLLNLSHNQLTQLEDFDDYQNCTSIGNLDISWNAFYYNMALPFWGSIQNGGNIYASHNTLSMIPCHWRMYGNTLDLSWNMFGYSTAPNNCGFGAFLHTNLAHNNFYTYLDAITSQFFSIYSLDLSGNRFYGYLPTQNPALFAGDCNCNSCFLNVGNNELSGAVPEYYCTLPATLNYAGNPYMTNATVCTTNQMCPWIE